MRGWLLCQPRPSSLRITGGDEQAHKFEITQGMRWTEAAQSVMALQPELVEALDDKGQLLRAIRPNDVEEEEEEGVSAEVLSIPADPESQRLVIFAKLIADAYRHSTDVAFDKLGALFDAVVRKSESQEKTISALDRMLQKLVLEKVANAAGEGGEEGGPLTLESLFGSFMQGKMAGAADKVANGATHKEPTK